MRVAVCFFLAGTTYGFVADIFETFLRDGGDVVIMLVLMMGEDKVEEEEEEALVQVLNIQLLGRFGWQTRRTPLWN